MTLILELELLTWWHAGTGRGAGEQADAVVHLDRNGLPWLPGRTMKGLLREAAEQGAAMSPPVLSAEDVAVWFGTGLTREGGGERVGKLEADRFTSTPGALRFSSATLGEAWVRWAAAAPDPDKELLRTTLSTTRIGERGVVEHRTLRAVEVAAPMTLRASVEGPDDRRWVQALTELLPLVRGLGSGRNRGLGRVELRAVEAA